MLLVADAGNTNITFGGFDGPGYRKRLRTFRLETDRARSASRYGAQIARALPHAPEHMVIGSGVPEVTTALSRACRDRFGFAPVVVTPLSAHGMTLALKHPERIGIDRIVNAVAAWEKLERACVIVDMGTATTLDVVDSRGRFAGGAILPGLHAAQSGLAARAPRLPIIEIKKPARAIGRDTVEAMQSGSFFGAVGAIDGLIGRMQREAGRKLAVIGTGGLVERIVGTSRYVKTIDPGLTLDGLRLAWLRITK